jgi:hypothetical protein
MLALHEVIQLQHKHLHPKAYRPPDRPHGGCTRSALSLARSASAEHRLCLCTAQTANTVSKWHHRTHNVVHKGT